MTLTLKYDNIEIATKIKIAKSTFNQILGLMFHKNIADNFAMIFTMNKITLVSVHMLFVFFPLDIIFLDENKKIIERAQLKPFTGYKTVKNVKYIIETKAGTIKKYNISINKQIEFNYN